MPKRSAGILPYRKSPRGIEVFLVHPGGPFWARKDLGAWSIAKGEFDTEDALAAARREFTEETGFPVSGELMALEPLRQRSGKIVYAWAMRAEGDPVDDGTAPAQPTLDPNALKSNSFELEWPPGSGKRQEFPEIDRAAWYPIDRARAKIVKGQVGFLSQLEEKLRRA